jgi:hypothetical protein
VGVGSVSDDLDVWPELPPSEYFLPVGASFSWRWPARHRWCAAAGRGWTRPLASSISQIAPGDRISIRLEVADRVDRTLPCADGDGTCSIGGDECLQRLTWEVEIR